MNLNQMIGELERQQERLEIALATLRGLVNENGEKRRGRPPKWVSQARENGVQSATPAKVNRVAKSVHKSTGKRKRFSAATRKKMAASQSKRWKLIRQAKTKAAKTAEG